MKKTFYSFCFMLWLVVLIPRSMIGQGMDVCVSISDDIMTASYIPNQDFNTSPSNFWNSQVLTVRYPNTITIDWSNFTDLTDLNFTEDPATVPPVDGGDGFLYKKFASNVVAATVNFSSGTPVDVFTIELITDTGFDIEAITDVTWTMSNNGQAAVNNASLGNVFNAYTTGCGSQTYIPVGQDTDGDGDDDRDEIDNGTDPNDPCSASNPDNLACDTGDFDGDGDTNGDETTNGTDPSDPCSASNPDNLACDSGDLDGDGDTNGDETTNGTDPSDPCSSSNPDNLACDTGDFDGDGDTNGDETTNGTDPSDPCSASNPDNLACDTGDFDSDGDTNGDETTNGTDPSDPCSASNPDNLACDTGDFDGDGDTNGDETTNGTDPSDPCSASNPDNLACDTGDFDGDGDTNGDEGTNGTDPSDPCSASNPDNLACDNGDADGDGDTNGDEITNGTDPGDPCSASNPDNLACDTGDFDGDGDTNGDETTNGTDPSDPCSASDPDNLACDTGDFDGDGDTNGDEVTNGTDPSDPCSASNPDNLACATGDFDGDGDTNGDETTNGTDPTDPCSASDPDNLACDTGDFDGDGDTNGDEVTNGTDPTDPCSASNPSNPACSVVVTTKVFLQGAYHANSGTMLDELRQANLIPGTEPYTNLADFNHVGPGSGEQAQTGLMQVIGTDAIVDWIFLELRDAADPSIVIATRAALVQRDGDVVEVDGSASVTFSGIVPGNYYLAIRHRNHLGVMTAQALAFGGSPSLVDFTVDTTPTFGTHARKLLIDGTALLWGGDLNRDGKITASGGSTDITPISSLVLLHPDNTQFSFTFPVPGYLVPDLTMSGQVVLSGALTDVALITANVINHPENSGVFSLTFEILEQLP